MIAEVDATNGIVNKEYVYGVSGRLATIDATGIYWHHNDHLGTPQALTNNAGSIVWSIDQSPFGITSVNEDIDGDGVNVTNNFRFPGQYFDAETGLNYNYFRTYDSFTGRYTQHDPIGLDGGYNSYRYTDNNPMIKIDIDGRKVQVYTRALEFSDTQRLAAYSYSLTFGTLVGVAVLRYYEEKAVHCGIKLKGCNGDNKSWEFNADGVGTPIKVPTNAKRQKTVTVESSNKKDEAVEAAIRQNTPGGRYSIFTNNCCQWVKRVFDKAGIPWRNPNPFPFN